MKSFVKKSTFIILRRFLNEKFLVSYWLKKYSTLIGWKAIGFKSSPTPKQSFLIQRRIVNAIILKRKQFWKWFENGWFDISTAVWSRGIFYSSWFWTGWWIWYRLEFLDHRWKIQRGQTHPSWCAFYILLVSYHVDIVNVRFGLFNLAFNDSIFTQFGTCNSEHVFYCLSYAKVTHHMTKNDSRVVQNLFCSIHRKFLFSWTTLSGFYKCNCTWCNFIYFEPSLVQTYRF